MKRQVGLKVQVPDWANWIAQDQNGEWWAFKENPYIEDSLDSWWAKSGTQHEIIGKTLNKNKWRKSL